MFALVVRFDVRDDVSAVRFDELSEQVVEEITVKEPGTLLYVTHRVDGEPLARVFYEVYADDEAFAAHEMAEHVVAFHSAKNRLLVSHRVEFLAPGTAKGLPGGL